MPVIAAHEFSLRELESHPLREQIYNGFDSSGDFQIADVFSAQRPNAPASDTLSYNFSLAMQAPAIEMMLRGFLVDTFARDAALRSLESKLADAKHILDALSRAIQDKGLNYNSGPALREIFYDRMKLPKVQRHEDGELVFPMDRKVLEFFDSYFFARPIALTALLCRDLSGQISVLRTNIDSDSRWRCSYNLGGTTTYRWSSSKSSIGTGSNFQNITEELRRVFISDPGWKLFGIDLEQADAREVGFFCGITFGDWTYLDACESGDLHTYVTRVAYPEWKWTGDLRADRALAERRFYRHFTFRDASKRMGHGTNFYGKPQRIHEETKIPLKVVREFQPRYFSAFPCIQRMHQWVAREIQTKGYLINVWGQRRDFLGRRNDDETLRQAIAFMFQSATGTRLNLGLYRVWHELGDRIQILSQLHDAIYFQVRESDDETEIVSRALDLMQIPLTSGGRTFTVPGEATAGRNWAHRYRLLEDGTRVEWNPKGLDKWRPKA